ncbi:hypothetical protein AAFH68_03110 [Flavobacterium sp. CGRL1]
MKIKLLLLTLLFFVKFGFAQNTVSYSSLNTTLNLDSGVEGTSDIVVSCTGNSGTPVVLNNFFLCGDPDGYISYLATNGLSLIPGQSTTLKFKFKRTVTTDTQVVYKFSTNGSCFQDESKMIKITVNYKATNTPTNPTVNKIYVEYNLYSTYVGQYDKINIFGNYSPSYTYEWQSKIANGAWTVIPGETEFTYSLKSPSVSISLKRIVKNILGVYVSESNVIDIAVYPRITNNTINLTGSFVEGSIPSGGVNSGGPYDYSWQVFVLEGETTIYNTNSRNFTVPEVVYNWMGSNNAYVRRAVKSGEQFSVSDAVVVTPAQEITNNIIALSGNNILGSLPNGGTGSFRYEYYLYLEDINGEVLDVYNVGSEKDYVLSGNYNLVTKIYRKVYSGNKVSFSNTITAPLAGSFAKKSSEKMQATSRDLAVYPNPTLESLNFATNFASDKNIEIVLYSEKLGNEKSVYKGKVTPNQVVNWTIPANYEKGLYFYKILSDNKEVKTGKIIFK